MAKGKNKIEKHQHPINSTGDDSMPIEIGDKDTYPAEAASYDPHTEQLISKQTASALLYLLFYSILMFTLPFGAFFGVRHLLETQFTDFSPFAINSISVVVSVITVYIIIGFYAYHAYHEVDVNVPEDPKMDPEQRKTIEESKEKRKKPKQKKL